MQVGSFLTGSKPSSSRLNRDSMAEEGQPKKKKKLRTDFFFPLYTAIRPAQTGSMSLELNFFSLIFSKKKKFNLFFTFLNMVALFDSQRNRVCFPLNPFRGSNSLAQESIHHQQHLPTQILEVSGRWKRNGLRSVKKNRD